VSKFTKDSEAKLLNMLGEELKVWEQIYTLTENQASLIELDDVEKLSESIDQRQELIEKIKGLHQESNALMQSYISVSGNDEGGKSAAIEAEKTKIRNKITACSQKNDKNIAEANKIKGTYIEKAEELGQQRKSIGAYALDVTNNSELFDTKG